MTKHTTEFWQQVIDEWKESGLSQHDYCKQRNISLSQFHYHRLKDLGTSSKFTRIEINQVPCEETVPENFTIIFPNGAKLEIGQLSMSDLKELLS